jgi:hypothetical protein
LDLEQLAGPILGELLVHYVVASNYSDIRIAEKPLDQNKARSLAVE